MSWTLVFVLLGGKMRQTIVVETRRVCGVARFYPVCALGRVFLALTGGKRVSLKEPELALIRQLGFIVRKKSISTAQPPKE